MLVRNIINIIFKFSVFFVIFIFIGYIVISAILKKKDKGGKLSTNKIRVFGLFMELDNFSVFAIAVALVRFIFVFYIICNRNDLINIHLFVLLLMSVLFGISSKSFKNLIIDLGSSAGLYFALFSSKLLSDYMLEVRVSWYILVGNVLLIVFVFMYSCYFLLRNINDVVSRTKYIRRYRNEEN